MISSLYIKLYSVYLYTLNNNVHYALLYTWYYEVKLFLPDPRGDGLHEAFQILSVRTYVRTSVRLHIRFQFYPTRPIYLGPPIFLQIPDLLCIDY